MTIVPTLETERLTLRAFCVADHGPFVEMSADAELMRFVGGQMDGPDAWRRMAAYTGMWALRGYGPWALQHKPTGAFVGYSGVTWPHGFPEPEINWGLHRGHLQGPRHGHLAPYAANQLSTRVSFREPRMT